MINLNTSSTPPRSIRLQGCREAGIRVTLITGDHAVTASAIGRMFAIIRGQSKALTGRELETMSDEDLFTKAQEVSIFAKVSHSKVIRRH